jgi:tape measure domain-containing protein
VAENYQIVVEVVNRASATLTEIKNQLGSIGTAANSNFSNVSSQLDAAAKRADMFSSAVQGIATVMAATAVLKYVDDIQVLDNRLRLVTNSQSEMNKTYDALFDIAQNTRQALAPTVDLYTKLKISQDATGLATGDLMKVVEAFNKTLLVSGTSTQGAASALYQFAQAMQSGRLQGDELRTMLEVNPILMKTLTEQTGFTTAELRKLASDGFLTAKIVGLALRDGLEDLNSQMGKMPITVGQAIQALKNSFQSVIRDMLEVSGTGNILVIAIQSIEYAIKPLTYALIALGAALTIAVLIKAVAFAFEAFTIAAGAATIATKGLSTALTFLAATPLGRVVSLVGLAAGAIYAFTDSAKATEKPTEKLSKTTEELAENSKKAAKGSQELKDELEKSGATAKINETAFSKYTDSLKEQIKYAGLFSKERRDMVEVEKILQQTVDEGRKRGVQYSQARLAEMRREAQQLLADRDARLKVTDEIEQRYNSYIQYIKTNQDKSLTDTQLYEKMFAQATIDRQTLTKFSEEEYQKYIAALRADYSKKYVDLIKKEKLANMTDNQKYAAELAQLEADRDAGRLSQDLSYEDAKFALQKKYAEDYIKMSEAGRIENLTAYGKYQEAMKKFDNDAAAQAVLTEEQKRAVLDKINKEYVAATANEYSNLYGFLNNKLVEMTGISKEKWGIMTDIVKIFGIDTNQLLKEAFALGITWIKSFVGLGAQQFSLLSSSGTISMGSLATSIISIFDATTDWFVGAWSWAKDGMVSALGKGFDWASSAVSSVASFMGSKLKAVFDWAWSAIGAIGNSIANWAFGGGGGGGGWVGTAISWGMSLFSDKRLKKNISYVGTNDKGINVYDFEYKNQYQDALGSGRYRGVLAQEVEKQVPGAVTSGGNGFKMVDYDKLGMGMEQIAKFAKGGIVGSPTMFNTGIGLAGEAGPEAILPLSRGANGQLGVDANGMGNVSVNFTINAIDGSSVRDMLVTNSTTITNIIRQAVQDRGTQQVLGV